MGVLQCNVALRKESVDRNLMCLVTFGAFMRVALRKESVDRNVYVPLAVPHLCKGSLSARRAWIEIW